MSHDLLSDIRLRTKALGDRVDITNLPESPLEVMDLLEESLQILEMMPDVIEDLRIENIEEKIKVFASLLRHQIGKTQSIFEMLQLMLGGNDLAP